MKKNIICLFLLLILAGCSVSLPDATPSDKLPVIFPDYTFVTIPSNIAPLNFRLTQRHSDAIAAIECGGQKMLLKEKGGQFTIPSSKWSEMLRQSIGKKLKVTVYAQNGSWIAYKPFTIAVAKEKMDPYIAYRLIDPGYELWNNIGIYQCNVENDKQSPIMENRLSDRNCMNCHSFCMQNPDKMLFHMRGKNGSTYLIDGNKIEKLNTKTDKTISALVYPSWHPGGRYVAFSVNDISQSFHQNDRNRIEVFDKASDVVVYDTQAHLVYSDSIVSRSDCFETFPTFSPDGRRLFFCSALARPMPQGYAEEKYSICSVSFDPETHTFGQTVDTLFSASRQGRSASFPRVSPDGKYLLFTVSNYGNFSIWHKDADLYMIHLKSGNLYPLTAANSNNVESYHSWCSNSHWFVFSSRRLDGLYTRPFFAHVDDQGNVSKAFLLPQKDTRYYDRLMKSYNVPEFIKGKVRNRMHKLAEIAKHDKGIDIRSAF